MIVTGTSPFASASPFSKTEAGPQGNASVAAPHGPEVSVTLSAKTGAVPNEASPESGAACWQDRIRMATERMEREIHLAQRNQGVAWMGGGGVRNESSPPQAKGAPGEGIGASPESDVNYWDTPAGRDGLRKANESMDKLLAQRSQQIAEMKAHGTWDGSPAAQLQQWLDAKGKVLDLRDAIIGLPKDKSIMLGGAASNLDSLVAAQYGLIVPTADPFSGRPSFVPNAESLGTIGIVGGFSSDAPDHGEAMFLVFDRETAATVIDATFTLRPADGGSPLNALLDTIQRNQEFPGATVGPYTRFDLVDGAGRTVGMVMSKGLDTLVQDKAADMLAAVFGIFQGSVSHSV
ncbi:hypothetical protein FBZ82_11050 [Azospirillum brasilense]|uniref:Uncharacterized protein n=1 Tax=Azospirillum brasilense TaxID=192 RepID=A0A560AVE5_AZOBR|nr:hypothetical protein [Azospirillum brasilense]TWA64360.1 hypothetical protein FBZ82_11050 [Azospirillum brasilense]